VKRATKKSIEKIQTLDIGVLDKEKKTKVLAGISVLGVISVMSNIKSVKKIENRCFEKAKELDFTETIKAFSGNGKD